MTVDEIMSADFPDENDVSTGVRPILRGLELMAREAANRGVSHDYAFVELIFAFFGAELGELPSTVQANPELIAELARDDTAFHRAWVQFSDEHTEGAQGKLLENPRLYVRLKKR